MIANIIIIIILVLIHIGNLFPLNKFPTKGDDFGKAIALVFWHCLEFFKKWKIPPHKYIKMTAIIIIFIILVLIHKGNFFTFKNFPLKIDDFGKAINLVFLAFFGFF